MTFIYVPGETIGTRTADHLLQGVAEIASSSISGSIARIGNGSYVMEHLDGIRGTADVRSSFTSISEDHGEFAGGAFYRGRAVDIWGTCRADTADDALAGCDLLKSQVNLTPATFFTLYVWYPDWAQRRTLPCRLSGPFEIMVPAPGEEAVPWRQFHIPLHSTDAFLYNFTQYGNTAAKDTATGGVGVTVPNLGDVNARPIYRLWGPFTAATVKIIDDSVSESFTLTNVTAVTGQYIDVDVKNRTVRRSLDSTNYYNAFSGSWMQIKPGGRPLRMTVSAGAGAATGYSVIYRDTWG